MDLIMNKKQTVVILFGGQSSEHEVSCKSAVTIISHIDTSKYVPVLIGITKSGKWLLVNSIEEINNNTWINSHTTAIISPDATDHGVILNDGKGCKKLYVDVIFPVLHGMYGEDGTVQGLFELCKIPYVGCGVLSSAISMDKFYTKIVVDTLNIRQAVYVGIHRHDLRDMDASVKRVEERLAYPVFVKPSKSGSSQGVSKACDRTELVAALRLAAEHDSKILVEETITGRELECAVLGGMDAIASNVGEIVAADAFYSYEAKYNNPESETLLTPELPDGTLETIRESALKIYRAVDGFGLSRVDFFLDSVTNEIVFNEINTLPGFTSISMYPMLWEAKGISKDELVNRLIRMAHDRE